MHAGVIHPNTAAWTNWTWPPDLWPVWAPPSLSTFIHFTDPARCSPVISCTPRNLWPVTTRDGNMNVLKLFIQSNWTAQNLTFSHPIASLRSSVTPRGQARQCGQRMTQSWPAVQQATRSLKKCPSLPLLSLDFGHAGANAWSCTYKLF